MNPSPLRAWLARIPKIELHLHIEGSIPLDAMWELVKKYGVPDDTPTKEALQERFAFRDFPHFIETWVWKNQFIRELDDFTFIAEAVANDLKRQNILYVEAFYSPPDFHRLGLSPQDITVALRKGLDKVRGIEIMLVADLVRDFGPQRAEATLSAVAEVRSEGVLGVGIGGSEQSVPPELFVNVYDRARHIGFYTSAHAGEAAGAASVRGAVEILEVDRIGHGTRAFEDEDLVDLLARRQIPIECCPLSNVCTGVVGSIADHPIREYYDKGLLVCVNTDDPAMFNNSLVDEFEALMNTLDFQAEDIKTLLLNAVEACWLDDVETMKLAEAIAGHAVWKEQ